MGFAKNIKMILRWLVFTMTFESFWDRVYFEHLGVFD